jgi:hypothetical protein
MNKYIYVLAIGIILTSCFFSRVDPVVPVYTKYEPIYMSRTELATSVRLEEARNISETGKIYIWEGYLFINEPRKGVHVYDNTNTANPIALGFISILGNIDITIKNGLLLADNATDLVSIDISNTNSIHVVKRLKNVFPELTPPDNFFIPDEFLPPNRPDTLIIVDWKIK